MKERQFIKRIIAESRMPPSVPVGPGDDLAVVRPPRGKLVYGVDTIVEGIDFYPPGHPKAPDPRLIGRKSVLVNLSDIAAMGAKPFCMVVSAAFRRSSSDSYVEAIHEGIRSVEREYGIALVGGDISAIDGPTVLTVAVIGVVPGKVLLRSGARPGHLLLVTGALGGSILGRHLDFPPRLAEGLFIAEHGASSCIDISDGLATDARHIAEMSRVTIEIDGAAVPVSEAAHILSGQDGVPPLRHALKDGEDFELLFTASRQAAARILKKWPFDTPVAIIGRVLKPEPAEETGQVFLVADNARTSLADIGYEHEI